ncbi:MAG: 30S ribosomal protein S6 [Exilispira sp.]
MQKKYELLIIFSTKEKKDINLLKNSAKEKIDLYEFSILSEQEMGNRNLAYPIKKQKEGFYQIYYISPKKDIPKVNELLKELRRDQDILRALIFVYDEQRLERIKQKEEEFKRRKIELENKKRMQAEQASKQITEETFQNEEMKKEGSNE